MPWLNIFQPWSSIGIIYASYDQIKSSVVNLKLVQKFRANQDPIDSPILNLFLFGLTHDFFN
jgi:hypothetical protein